MNREIRIDLSGLTPRVFIDGELTRTVLDITYAEPPADPLTVEKLTFTVKRDPPSPPKPDSHRPVG